MALAVKHESGLFKIDGELNAQNTKTLKEHYEMHLKQLGDIILSLEGVTKLDESSARSLEQMYLSAVRENCILEIIGLENASIVPVMTRTKTSYILSNDRV